MIYSPANNTIPPDIELLKASKNALDRLYSQIGPVYLPPLQQQLDTVKKQRRLLDGQLHELLVTLPVKLQINSVDRLLQEGRSNPANQAMYSAEILSIIASSLVEAQSDTAVIEGSLEKFKAISVSDVSVVIETLQQQSENKSGEKQTLQASLDALKKQKQEFDAAMRVMEDKTLFDEWTPILIDAIKLGSKNPALALIQAAAVGVANMLRIASEAVKYGDLLEARKQIQEQMDERLNTIRQYNDQLQTLVRQQKQLTDVQAIARHKSDYESQMGKVHAAVMFFLNIAPKAVDEDAFEYASHYISRTTALLDILNDLRKRLK